MMGLTQSADWNKSPSDSAEQQRQLLASWTQWQLLDYQYVISQPVPSVPLGGYFDNCADTAPPLIPDSDPEVMDR
jgi:hypothetical protein